MGTHDKVGKDFLVGTPDKGYLINDAPFVSAEEQYLFVNVNHVMDGQVPANVVDNVERQRWQRW